MTTAELIAALAKVEDQDAPVFIELSGDSDFAEVERLVSFTVTNNGRSCPVLSIGWGLAHTPMEAWNNPEKWDGGE